MKKSFFIFVTVALSVFIALPANAQKSKSFAGIIKFFTTVESGSDTNARCPGKCVYTILGNKIKTFDSRGITYIMDGNTVTMTAIYDIKGYKSGYTVSKKYFEEIQSTKRYVYEKVDETKTICGYVCTRYNITIYDTDEDEEVKLIVYTTTLIGENNNINAFEYPGLSGFPLYIETEYKDVKIIEKAIEIKKTKVKPSDFSVPTAYKMFSSQEEWEQYIQSVFGKNE